VKIGLKSERGATREDGNIIRLLFFVEKVQ